MLSSNRPNGVILRRSDEQTVVGRTAATPFHLRYNTHRVTKTHESDRRGEPCHDPDARLQSPISSLPSFGGPSCSSRGNRFLFGLGSDPSRLPNPGRKSEQARENGSRCLGACSLDDSSDSRSERECSAGHNEKTTAITIKAAFSRTRDRQGWDRLRLFQLSTRLREHLLIS